MSYSKDHRPVKQPISFLATSSRSEQNLAVTNSSSPSYFSVSPYERGARDCAEEPTDILDRQSTKDAGWRRALATEPMKHLAAAGWRQGARMALLVVSACLLVNLCITIWAVAQFGTGNAIVEVFRGDCKRAESVNTWVHLVINALSTTMLSGSNFCMQCLSAPSRKDVNLAHSRRKWLDIGVTSVRNLSSIPKKNVLLWTLLAFSSVPQHLMFNSAAFTSITTNDYNIIYVTENLMRGGQWEFDASSGPGLIWQPPDFNLTPVQRDVTSYERLSNSKCIQAYGNDLITDRRTLVIVSSNISTGDIDDSLLFANNLELPDISESYDPFPWICNGSALVSNFLCYQVLPQLLSDANSWKPSDYSVEYCLSQRVKGECGFSIILIITLVVILCNVGKTVAMYCVAFRKLAVPLTTIGDAVESYLDNPPSDSRVYKLINHDATTRKTRQDWGPRIWKPSTQRRFDAVTRNRWRSFLILFVGSICLIGLLLALAIISLPPGTSSASNLRKLGLGQVHAQSLIKGWGIANMGSKEAAITSSVLVANTPQVLLSLLYFALNSLLTSMALADEWTAYAHEYKALRVSNPRGQQRKTHFLSLPYKVSIPLMLTSGILHWLVSQSLFTAVVAKKNELGNLVKSIAIASCGFSPIGMILTMIVMALVIAVTLILGKQRLRTGIPLVGSSSAAIALACRGSKSGITTRPIRWGLLIEDGSVARSGRHGFSDKEISPSIWGHAYAIGPDA